MPQAKVYATNAERQASYRARHRDREPARQSVLANRALTLHEWMSRAVQEGRSPWPAELLATRADETMLKLIRYLRTSVEGEEES